MLLSRLHTISAAILLGLLLALARAPAAQEQTTVSNVFFNTNLRVAIEDLAAQAGVNIIAGPAVQGVVSVEFEDVTVRKALDLMVAGTEYLVYEDPNYYLVYAPDAQSGLLRSVSETEVVQISNLPANTARDLLADPLQRYVQADDTSRTISITAPPQIIERIRQDLEKIDTPAETATRVIPIQNLDAQTALQALPRSLRNYARLDAERNAVVVSAPPQLARNVADQLAEIDVPTLSERADDDAFSETRIIKLDYVSATTASNLLPERFTDYVKVDETTNAVSISAPAEESDEIAGYIEAIDTERQHVMLDARVVVLDRSDLLNFGVDWDFPTAQAGTFTDDTTGAPDFPYALQIGYTPSRQFTQALSLNLNLLSRNDEAAIVASPKVLAQDGREAQISITTEEFFEVTGDESAFVRAELEKIETGTIMYIKPRIGNDGDLTLDLRIEVSDVIARGEQNLPVVSRRKARSTVQIENGGTAAVAGLVDTRSQTAIDGVPSASRLPLIGNAFGTDELDRRERQVAVFVTATLVEDGDPLFTNGRRQGPAPEKVDEAAYREELEQALKLIEPGPKAE
jgi:type II secretory pathway component GspD/PulD (secretin)